MHQNRNYRVTSQFLAPGKYHPLSKGGYDIYPSQNIGDGKIESGLEALANRLKGEKTVMIDGYIGVFWDDFREQLDQVFERQGVSVNEAEKWLAPNLGYDPNAANAA